MQTQLIRRIAPAPELTKVAATKLSGDAEQWPIAVLNEAYRQQPTLARFDLDVNLQESDPVRGYAVGRVLVFPMGMDKKAALREQRLGVLPFVIRENALSPFDVMALKGELEPMDVQKLAAVLLPVRTLKGPAPEGILTDNYSLGGMAVSPTLDAGTGLSGFAKVSSARPTGARFLKTAASHAPEALREEALNRYYADPTFRMTLALPALEKKAYAVFASLLSQREMAKTAAPYKPEDHLRPDVWQVRLDGDGAIILEGNRSAWDLKERRVPLQKLAGLSKKARAALERDGYVTWSLARPPEAPLQKVAMAETEGCGTFEVRRGGTTEYAIVIDRVVGLDGKPHPGRKFVTSTEAHGEQEKLAGRRVGNLPRIPEAPMRGCGVFCYQSGDTAVVTTPLEILSEVTEDSRENGEVVKVAYFLGRDLETNTALQIFQVPGLELPQYTPPVQEGQMALLGIPAEMQFLPVGKPFARFEETPPALTQELYKTASGYVEVVGSHGEWQLNGHPLLASEIWRAPDIEFALCALGHTVSSARDWMSKTANARLRVPVFQDLVPYAEFRKQATEGLAKMAASAPAFPRIDLWGVLPTLAMPPEAWAPSWKAGMELCGLEKTALESPQETLDTVLGLNFVTPENALLYVDYLPALEKAASHLAELLLAARMGMENVQEQACKTAMLQVGHVVRSLRDLSSRIQ